MRVAVIGGTRFLGPVVVKLLCAAGHDVSVCHTGAHEHPGLPDVEHLHGERDALLSAGGPVERWHPHALVDTFPGGASAAKATALLGSARASEAGHVIAVSSIDAYAYLVEAGLGDGSGICPLPSGRLPLDENAPLRSAPYPGAAAGHDNVAMESALHDGQRVTALRPGAIYGPHPSVREWTLVEKVARGESRLELPDGGVQLFHRAAVERVGRAVVAALERAPDGFWACNVADPYDWSYAGLAKQVGDLLDWTWEPARVAYSRTEEQHPWCTAQPVLVSDRRLREVLGVLAPDPLDALRETVEWLWEHRERLAAD